MIDVRNRFYWRCDFCFGYDAKFQELSLPV